MILLFLIILGKGVRKGEELKAPRYASAAAIYNYITARNIIPNTYKELLLIKLTNELKNGIFIKLYY